MISTGTKRATEEGPLPDIAQYISYYLNMLLLPKDQAFTFINFLLLQLCYCFLITLCCTIISLFIVAPGRPSTK